MKSKIASTRRKLLGLQEMIDLLSEIKHLIHGNHGNINSDWLLKEIGNIKFLLDRRSMVDQEIAKNGTWEEESWLTLMRNLDLFDSSHEIEFLDIGSYFGLYAIKAQQTRRFTRIACFEWDEINFAQLRANLLINNLFKEIECHKVFLGEARKTKRVLASETNVLNRGMSGVTSVDKRNFELVQSTSLDSLWKSRGSQIVMKIDVEGNEIEVLNGAKRLIQNNNVLLLVEHLKFTNKEITFMKRLGFRLLEQISKDHNYLYTNVVMANNSFQRD